MTKPLTLAQIERRVILAAIRRHGTPPKAAKALGIGVRTIQVKLKTWREEAKQPKPVNS